MRDPNSFLCQYVTMATTPIYFLSPTQKTCPLLNIPVLVVDVSELCLAFPPVSSVRSHALCPLLNLLEKKVCSNPLPSTWRYLLSCYCWVVRIFFIDIYELSPSLLDARFTIFSFIQCPLNSARLPTKFVVVFWDRALAVLPRLALNSSVQMIFLSQAPEAVATEQATAQALNCW